MSPAKKVAENRRLITYRTGLDQDQLDFLVKRSEGRCECCREISRELLVFVAPPVWIRGLVCRACHVQIRNPPQEMPPWITAWLAHDWEHNQFMPAVKSPVVRRKLAGTGYHSG